MNNLVLSNFLRSKYNSAEFYSAGGLYDHMIAHLHFIILRIKIIYFADISESDSNYFCHSISP